MEATTLIQLSQTDLEEVVTCAVAKALELGNDDGFVRVPEAAKYLSLSEHALRALVKREQILFHKVGERILFDKAELRAWVHDPGRSA